MILIEQCALLAKYITHIPFHFLPHVALYIRVLREQMQCVRDGNGGRVVARKEESHEVVVEDLCGNHLQGVGACPSHRISPGNVIDTDFSTVVEYLRVNTLGFLVPGFPAMPQCHSGCNAPHLNR